MSKINSKSRKENNKVPETGKLVLTFIVVLCAAIFFTMECFQTKNFFDSTVAVSATVEQIEESQDGYFIKMSYKHNGKAYTDISWYKSDRGYTEGETKGIRILSTSPDVVYPQKTYIRDMSLKTGMLMVASCSFIYEIVQYVKSKKEKNLTSV